MQSDWQVNARAFVGFATIIKTIPRTMSMAKRIPALLYIAKFFIVILSKHDATVRKLARKNLACSEITQAVGFLGSVLEQPFP